MGVAVVGVKEGGGPPRQGAGRRRGAVLSPAKFDRRRLWFRVWGLADLEGLGFRVCLGFQTPPETPKPYLNLQGAAGGIGA